MPRVARISSGSAVTGLTAAAMAVVCVLAFQASGSTPDTPPPDRPAASATPERSGSPTARTPEAPPVPEASGTGKRVVYALADRRVWLVDGDEKVVRTYKVAPSSVSPVPGNYRVTLRNGKITGSDGVPVEHVVVFGSLGETVIGFSAALDGSTPDASAPRRTGGIRETRKDGAAMWAFAVIGVKVIVVA